MECGKEFAHDQKCRVRDLKHFALPSSTKSCLSLSSLNQIQTMRTQSASSFGFYTAIIEVCDECLCSRGTCRELRERNSKKKRKRQIFNFLNNINFSRSTFSSFQTRLTRSHLTREHTNATVLSLFMLLQLYIFCSFLFTLDRCTSFVIRSTFADHLKTQQRPREKRQQTNLTLITDYQKV